MNSASVLLVGIGSAHGDDRVGWSVAAAVAQRAGDQVRVRTAAAPADLLDWLAGVDRLHLCDAWLTSEPGGQLTQWSFPDPAIESAGFGSTHSLSLPAALRLAAELGTLPREVILWGVSIERAEPGAPLSPRVAAAVPRIAERICEVLEYA
ncbi:MAG: hydrogenase maturation protease [Planctomycetaceae bacterium]|nr:hydrogenase maturation protease [Planctomycetaceae bacterium]